MNIFIYGSSLYALSFFLQVIIWRIHLPKRQTKALLILYFGVLFFGTIFSQVLFSKISIFGFHLPVSYCEYFQMWLYYVSLTLAYMITYSAIEADSPSLSMILMIQHAGLGGLEPGKIKEKLDNSLLIEPRIRDLIVNQMVEEHQGKYRLKKKGILMARIFKSYRTLLGAGKGG